MFEVDARHNCIEVSGDSIEALDIVAEEVCQNVADKKTPHLLEIAAARGEAARDVDQPTVMLSIEATEFFQEQASQIVSEESQQETTLRQRIYQFFSGRLIAMKTVRDEAAEALETAQNFTEGDESTREHVESYELPTALDAMSLAMHARSVRQKQDTAEPADDSSDSLLTSAVDDSSVDVMAELGIY